MICPTSGENCVQTNFFTLSLTPLKVQDYLEVNIIHLHDNVFACTNFRKCRSFRACWNLLKGTEKFGIMFQFYILYLYLCFVIVFGENLKFYKIVKFHPHKNIATQGTSEKGVRISILSRGDASSTPALGVEITFTRTLEFWSPPQLPRKLGSPN